MLDNIQTYGAQRGIYDVGCNLNAIVKLDPIPAFIHNLGFRG